MRVVSIFSILNNFIENQFKTKSIDDVCYQFCLPKVTTVRLCIRNTVTLFFYNTA